METTEWRTDKIYDRCAYLNCYNGKRSTGHKLFRFPAYSDSRHHLWIRYAGNVRLRTWASATLRRAGICAEHFDPECFVDDNRRTLRRNAVPRPYSASNVHAKPSSTLLAQIKSLPRRQTKARRSSDVEEFEVEELEAQKSPRISDAEASRSTVVEKPKPVEPPIAKAVKTLRRVSRIKIEEQVSNSSRTVILERCKNPETCPASSQTAATRRGGKPRPHFHKVYAKSAEEIGISASYGALKSCNSIAGQAKDESFQEFCNDTVRNEPRDEKATKGNEKPSFRLERYHISLTKAQPRKDESSTTSRYTEEPENMMSSWQAIQEARAAPALASAGEYKRNNNEKNPSTTEIIDEYYRTKDENSYDRCVYINCKNGRLTTGVHLFRFPQITDPRLTTWIKNAGNPRMLYWSWSTIRRSGLCGDHFTKDSFFNETRQRLLRTAVPKPFYLEKNVSADGQGENLSPGDLLEVLNIIEQECESDAEGPTEPVPIDLPSEETENRETLKIRYPFEDPELVETDGEELEKREIENEDCYESFASVMVKNELVDRQKDDETLSTSGRTFFKEESIEEPDPLDDTNVAHEDDPEGVDNIREILALEQQKARLCRVIKQFSSKLKDAKLHKNKLRSRLHSRGDARLH